MTIFDVFLVPIYLGIFYFFARRTVNANRHDPLYRIYYIKGLNYKFFGAFSFAMIYLYYYKGGDTIAYYDDASPVMKLLVIDPLWFFKFIFGLYNHYPEVLMRDTRSTGTLYLTKGSATLTTLRIASVLNIFSLNSFMVLTFFFAFICYHFIWRAFKLMVSIYPTLHKQFSYAFLMIPSVIFWGSGIGKDTIMLGAIMLFFYTYYHVVILKQFKASHFILFFLSAYVTALIRGFILFTLIPCVMMMTMVYYQRQIRSSFLRFLIGPILLVGGGGASYFFVKSLGDTVESYKIDSLEKKAEGFHSWHTHLAQVEGGSAYSLGGDISYTPAGILRQAPMAILISLFGPFIWQIRSPVMLLSGIESLAFLYFFIKIIFNRKVYKLGAVLSSDPILAFCIPFVIILAVAIGMTSFNYGALVRYKIPILPFLAIVIILVNYYFDKEKT
jgi:hypothetical protein